MRQGCCRLQQSERPEHSQPGKAQLPALPPSAHQGATLGYVMLLNSSQACKEGCGGCGGWPHAPADAPQPWHALYSVPALSSRLTALTGIHSGCCSGCCGGWYAAPAALALPFTPCACVHADSAPARMLQPPLPAAVLRHAHVLPCMHGVPLFLAHILTRKNPSCNGPGSGTAGCRSQGRSSCWPPSPQWPCTWGPRAPS